jgi:hypothetical protein
MTIRPAYLNGVRTDAPGLAGGGRALRGGHAKAGADGRATARAVAIVLVLVLVATLGGCTRPAADDDFFPLTPGHMWQYRVSHLDIAHDPGPSSHEVRTLRTVTVDGNRVYRRIDSLGNEYHFRRDDGGIRRVAMRDAAELTAQPDVPPRDVLRFPLTTGQSWQATTHPYAIRRLVPFGGNLTGRYSLSLTFTVEQVGVAVDTPAGRFENCVMIIGEGTLEVYGDARRGFISVPVIHTEWYAPGVGLVKLEREETVDTELFSGGTIRFELTDYR